VWFYIISCLSDDHESQRLGYVFIVFLHHVKFENVDVNTGISQIMASGLIRLDTARDRAARATILLMIGATIRCRVRFHIGEFLSRSLSPFSPLFFDLGANHAMFLPLSSTFAGSPSECLYSLRTFGIPTDSLPAIPEEGAKDALRNHYKWCLTHQTKV
jgi:hypothetical protein